MFKRYQKTATDPLGLGLGPKPDLVEEPSVGRMREECDQHIAAMLLMLKQAREVHAELMAKRIQAWLDECERGADARGQLEQARELNAELLAALQETLEEGIGWYDVRVLYLSRTFGCSGGDPGNLDWVQRARAVIAKATGSAKP